METSKKHNSMDDTHLSSSWEILDTKMNKSEFTNVKKLQDPVPHFYCFREELRPRKKAPLKKWQAVFAFITFPESWSREQQTSLGIYYFCNFFFLSPKWEMKNFNRPLSNSISHAFQKETKKLIKSWQKLYV